MNQNRTNKTLHLLFMSQNGLVFQKFCNKGACLMVVLMLHIAVFCSTEWCAACRFSYLVYYVPKVIFKTNNYFESHGTSNTLQRKTMFKFVRYQRYTSLALLCSSITFTVNYEITSRDIKLLRLERSSPSSQF